MSYVQVSSSPFCTRPFCLKPPFAALQTRGFPCFSGKVLIMSQTISAIFLAGPLDRPRKRKRTNPEVRYPGPLCKSTFTDSCHSKPFVAIVAKLCRTCFGVENIRNEKSARIFLHKVFLRTPRVMDVRAFGTRTSAQKHFIFLRSERWGESFWVGTSARTSAGPPKNSMFRLLFRS